MLTLSPENIIDKGMISEETGDDGDGINTREKNRRGSTSRESSFIWHRDPYTLFDSVLSGVIPPPNLLHVLVKILVIERL